MPDLSWETWLAEAFPAYLLHCAEGRSRPALAIARALRHLDAGDLATLATIAFLLTPEHGVDDLVADVLPRYVRRVYPRTERIQQEVRGQVRGRVDWGRTLVLRQQTGDPTRAITTTQRRTFDTPELRLVRWLVARIHHAAATLSPGAYARDGTWVARVRRIHRGAEELLRAAALRDLADRPLDLATLTTCTHSRDDAIRRAAEVARIYTRLHPPQDHDTLADLLRRYALIPIDEDTRFELFSALALIDAVDRCLPGATRRNALIRPKRQAITTWQIGQVTLRLFYNQAGRPGAYQRALRQAYDIEGSLRPDLRLEYRDARGPKRRVELLVDAKRSDSKSYLRAAYLKMHGYLADRPEVFDREVNPKAIVVSLRDLQRPPPAGEPVVFLDPPHSLLGGSLDALLTAWLAALGIALPAAAASEEDLARGEGAKSNL